MFRSLIHRRLFASSLTAALVGVSLLGTALPARAESEIIARGTFEGQGNHAVSGRVTIVKTESGTVVMLEPDFSFDGAPDPKLAFGNDGYDASTLFSVLESNTGAQTYVLPANLNAENYDEFWIWCEEFDVPLGVAELE